MNPTCTASGFEQPALQTEGMGLQSTLLIATLVAPSSAAEMYLVTCPCWLFPAQNISMTSYIWMVRTEVRQTVVGPQDGLTLLNICIFPGASAVLPWWKFGRLDRCTHTYLNAYEVLSERHVPFHGKTFAISERKQLTRLYIIYLQIHLGNHWSDWMSIAEMQ